MNQIAKIDQIIALNFIFILFFLTFFIIIFRIWQLRRLIFRNCIEFRQKASVSLTKLPKTWLGHHLKFNQLTQFISLAFFFFRYYFYLHVSFHSLYFCYFSLFFVFNPPLLLRFLSSANLAFLHLIRIIRLNPHPHCFREHPEPKGALGSEVLLVLVLVLVLFQVYPYSMN